MEKIKTLHLKGDGNNLKVLTHKEHMIMGHP